MSFQDNQDQEGIFDINVTPFVDVLLVLLVIFMVTTPIMIQQSLKINLPNSKTVDSVDPSTLSVTISSQGQYFINGKLSTIEEISEVAKSMFNQNASTQVVLAADLESQHKYVVEVMDKVRQVGITKFAFQVLKQE
ncbi:MAG: biopolymer transporter ExbD [Bdellovibrionota bacterium]